MAGFAIQEDNTNVVYEPPRRNYVDIRASYLLVSPILPPLAWLLGGVRVVGTNTSTETGQDAQAQKHSVMLRRSILAIIGERDGFTSAKKVRKWARDHVAEVAEVPEAGHFWSEEGVIRSMKERVERWIVQET